MQVLVGRGWLAGGHAIRLQHQPGRVGLPVLAQITAGVAQRDRDAGLRRDRGQPAERRVDGLVGAVASARQHGIDALALDVEQDRILERRRKHASLLEPDNEHERAAGEAGGRE